MPSISVDVDIEIDDIYDDLSSCDRDRLISWLHKDGHLSEYMRLNGIDEPTTLTDDTFVTDCMSLSDAYYRMSKEDIETVRALVAKYKYY
jgi:hypothetical protein